MTLAFDARAQLGNEPGLHAFVAGISAYRHLPGGSGEPAPDDFEMGQLSAAARSAFRVYEWLLARQAHLPVPLATIRLLLAPSASELQAEPAMGASAGATLSELRREAKAWRADASTDPSAVTFFYFAGHGVQRTKGDAVLLLEDFGDGEGGILDKAVNTKNINNGMAPSPNFFPNIARTQLYFVDACRSMHERFQQYEQLATSNVWDVELAGVDNRRAPTYFATIPGAPAYARPGGQTLFSEALLDCLNGAAAEPEDEQGQDRWRVTHHTLAEKLSKQVAELAGNEEAEQWVTSDGLGGDTAIHYLDDPPNVELELELDPPDALAYAQIAILNDTGAPAGQPLPKPLDPHPFSASLPAGIYTIKAAINPPQPSYVNQSGRARAIFPPRCRRVIRVRP
jgi:Caspase domain